MTATEIYEASAIKKRERRNGAAMEEANRFLIDYAALHGPVTVRQLYYRAEISGLPGIDKGQRGYVKIQRQVLKLRRKGRLPYRDIADLTRWMRKPRTFDSVEEALRDTAEFYRKALWRDIDVYVEIWLEKDALAGVIYPVTALYDVPLMVARGFSSETFCFEAVEARVDDDRPFIVYYLGDFDRSGRDAAATLREKLERFAAQRGVEVAFTHLVIENDDLIEFDEHTQLANIRIGEVFRWLPTREPKRNSAADRAWPHPFACELDAIEPDDLRAVVRWAIEHHLPPDQLKILQAAEKSERELIAGLVAEITPDGSAR